MPDGYISEIAIGYKPFNFEQYDYYIGSNLDKIYDYEGVVIIVSVDRAYALEDEVIPMVTLVRARNKKISELGDVMGDISQAINSFDSDDKMDDTTDVRNASADRGILSSYGVTCYIGSDGKISKGDAQKQQSKLQHDIDLEDNNLQQDMITLQSYVSKRDQGFSTAAQLMKKVSGTRTKVLNNIES